MPAVQYLQEVVRRRMLPSALADKISIAQPGSDESARRSETHQIARSIDDLLTTAIPAGPEYNFQRLYALRAIRGAGFDRQDPQSEAGSANIRGIIGAIDRKRPQFAQNVSVEIVDELYKKLQSYSKIKGGDPREFPPIDNLGHRYDEVSRQRGNVARRGAMIHCASLSQMFAPAPEREWPSSSGCSRLLPRPSELLDAGQSPHPELA
ncbi:hypothetical protein BC361_20940 [Ensifer sp. LC54]|nr:hypothetical protein BC363_24460 [Ensifer sp. LC384]OCP24274.1 hypothetical protein BC361_20940 [Ensifer sp. LC54]